MCRIRACRSVHAYVKNAHFETKKNLAISPNCVVGYFFCCKIVFLMIIIVTRAVSELNGSGVPYVKMTFTFSRFERSAGTDSTGDFGGIRPGQQIFEGRPDVTV